jgi:hypothetical protein
MAPEQAQLTAAFPNFIDTIENVLEVDDFHIMVVDTDAETRCTQQACGGQPHWTCNNYACMNIFDQCDETRGAGVVHPAGDSASDELCDIWGGNRYIIKGEPNLTDTFECMATVGLAGHPSERPMDGIVEAISDPLNAQNGCNEGFLRDDAILVITFISDDPNVEDVNTAMQTYQAVIDAKDGDEDKTVVLGLIPELPPVCTPINKPNAGMHWSDFITLFGQQGVEGSVCDNDYNQFFVDAVDIIDFTCDINPQ